MGFLRVLHSPLRSTNRHYGQSKTPLGVSVSVNGVCALQLTGDLSSVYSLLLLHVIARDILQGAVLKNNFFIGTHKVKGMKKGQTSIQLRICGMT